MSLKSWLKSPIQSTAVALNEKIHGRRTIRRTKSGAAAGSIPSDSFSVNESDGSISLRIREKVHKIATEETS